MTSQDTIILTYVVEPDDDFNAFDDDDDAAADDGEEVEAPKEETQAAGEEQEEEDDTDLIKEVVMGLILFGFLIFVFFVGYYAYLRKKNLKNLKAKQDLESQNKSQSERLSQSKYHFDFLGVSESNQSEKNAHKENWKNLENRDLESQSGKNANNEKKNLKENLNVKEGPE